MVGRRGTSSLTFRGETVVESFTGFTDRPAFANAREIGEAVTSRYIDEELDRVELIYNRYVSPLTQYVRRQTLLPLQEAEVYGEGIPDEPEEPTIRSSPRRRAAPTGSTSRSPRRRSRCSSPSTSTSRSSGRCSSRPPPSTARG